jgi:hypothetical protein
LIEEIPGFEEKLGTKGRVKKPWLPLAPFHFLGVKRAWETEKKLLRGGTLKL